MRIFHLIHSEGVYGAELILVYLSREVQRLGHEVIIGSIYDPGVPTTPFEAFAAGAGIRVEPVRIPPRPTPGVVKSVLRTIRNVGADVVHTHGYKPNILLGALPRRWRVPMVATLHGWASPPWSMLRLYHALDSLFLCAVEKTVLVAPHMNQLPGIRRVPERKRIVVENGIPPLPERLAIQQGTGAGPVPPELARFVAERPTFVAVGRLSPEKAFDRLIDAFALVSAEFPSHQLLIVGEGDERPVLEQRIARSGLQGRIRLPGFVAGADRLLEHAAGFLMCSLTEGLPLAVLEAMQWQVPIASSAVGAIPTLLKQGEAGLLFPPGDTQAIERALRQLMAQADGQADDPTNANRRMVAAAHDVVSSKYSSAHMAAGYLAVYQNVLNARS